MHRIYKQEIQKEPKPIAWLKEGALRWEGEAKFGAGNDDWRERARAALQRSRQKAA